ncbi:MAG: hypothetical protein Q8K28_14290 [Hoeflea sp.]|uniref:hypothetical protein n=1 Tax=Hoeflea sp. TaxID=1940281 RepID=UPI002732060C|nr:hypothetical protein [Hoeflea sp.]MDP2121063.1 hypothetical protein [Hoeflea sp.]
MADFVAVIRKAVDNLSENTPENRSKVYSKARAAIRRQLEAINPQPSDEVIARQLDKLDLAIQDVESEHAEALPADADETDALMAELESMVEKSPVLAAPVVPPSAPPPAPARDPAPFPATGAAAAPVPSWRDRIVPRPADTVPAEPRLEPQPRFQPQAPAEAPLSPEPAARPFDLVGDAHDEAFGLSQAPPRPEKASRTRAPAASGRGAGKGAIAALVVVLLLLGVAAFAGWSYKDSISAMFSPGAVDTPVAQEDAPAATETASVAPEPAGEEPGSLEPSAAVAPAGDDAKFTQRLNPDGSEIDAGPAPGPAVDDTVEGRSVAELTDEGAAEDPAADDAATDAPVAPEGATAPAAQPLGVTQKMILYEERLGQQSLEVKEGTVVWTLVSEPSGDGPDEQVIRGEINNPDKGLSALITIKRNTDPSLPASHIIEMVFALPPDFEGGSIDQLQRIAMKQTEADQGNPLIAVPAKITQDFYMVALNDLAEARNANNDLMRQRNWIDIPVVYANGRQALITLEKGASGTEVFNQALDAWARAEPGQ